MWNVGNITCATFNVCKRRVYRVLFIAVRNPLVSYVSLQCIGVEQEQEVFCYTE